MRVNIYAAKTHLSRLIEQVNAGEEIVITRHGRPVARLVPASEARPRKPARSKERGAGSPTISTIRCPTICWTCLREPGTEWP